jgi:hypothetical protein
MKTFPSARSLSREPSLRSRHLFARRNLPRAQERLNQLALAADNHLGETLEPLTLRNFWIGGQPAPAVKSRSRVVELA